ncbi:MAG: RNA-binding protein [Nitrosomonadales bacterium]|nr:RNA-binding protein [Nitrosomonadales bacterium]
MNIFVSNLDRSVTPHDLRHAFSVYGTITNINIIRHAQESDKPLHANVHLLPEHAAREALEELHMVPLRGRPIKVRQCVYRRIQDRRELPAHGIKMDRRRGIDRRIDTNAPSF